MHSYLWFDSTRVRTHVDDLLTNKTDRYNITETFIKVALNTNNTYHKQATCI